MSIKAIGIATKLTLEGESQVSYPQTWFFVTVAFFCVITQLNYLNKVCYCLSVCQLLSIFCIFTFSFGGWFAICYIARLIAIWETWLSLDLYPLGGF